MANNPMPHEPVYQITNVSARSAVAPVGPSTANSNPELQKLLTKINDHNVQAQRAGSYNVNDAAATADDDVFNPTFNTSELLKAAEKGLGPEYDMYSPSTTGGTNDPTPAPTPKPATSRRHRRNKDTPSRRELKDKDQPPEMSQKRRRNVARSDTSVRRYQKGHYIITKEEYCNPGQTPEELWQMDRWVVKQKQELAEINETQQDVIPQLAEEILDRKNYLDTLQCVNPDCYMVTEAQKMCKSLEQKVELLNNAADKKTLNLQEVHDELRNMNDIMRQYRPTPIPSDPAKLELYNRVHLDLHFGRIDVSEPDVWTSLLPLPRGEKIRLIRDKQDSTQQNVLSQLTPLKDEARLNYLYCWIDPSCDHTKLERKADSYFDLIGLLQRIWRNFDRYPTPFSRMVYIHEGMLNVLNQYRIMIEEGHIPADELDFGEYEHPEELTQQIRDLAIPANINPEWYDGNDRDFGLPHDQVLDSEFNEYFNRNL